METITARMMYITDLNAIAIAAVHERERKHGEPFLPFEIADLHPGIGWSTKANGEFRARECVRFEDELMRMFRSHGLQPRHSDKLEDIHKADNIAAKFGPHVSWSPSSDGARSKSKTETLLDKIEEASHEPHTAEKD